MTATAALAEPLDLIIPPRWAEAIADGDVRCALRPNAMDAQRGDTLRLFMGTRDGPRTLLGESTITRIDTVSINEIGMRLNRRELYTQLESRISGEQNGEEFAQSTGFEGFTEMAVWLATVHGLPFEGVAITWGELR